MELRHIDLSYLLDECDLSGLQTGPTFPSEVRYFCEIHDREEVAVFYDIQPTFSDLPVCGLYNTPDGYTLSNSQIFSLVKGYQNIDFWLKHSLNPTLIQKILAGDISSDDLPYLVETN